MKRRFIILLLAFLMLLTGCAEEKPAESTTSSLNNATTLYQKAYNNLKAQENICVTVQHNRAITQDEQTFSHTVDSVITCRNIGTSQMSAKVKQRQLFDAYEFSNELLLIDGVGYYNIAEGKFKKKLSESDFVKEHPFLLAPTPDLYQDIHGTTDGATNSFTFENASAVEQWLGVKKTTIETVSGNAIVSDGRIMSCNYTARYKHKSYIVEDIITVQFDYDVIEIEKPAEDDYIASTHPEALLLIEQAVGNLRQANLVSSSTEETIACKAYNEYQDVRTQLIELHLCDRDQFLSSLDISTNLSSRGGEPTKQTQKISFVNGEYATIMNSEDPVVQKDITDKQMKSYCTEYLESTIMMAKHITDVNIVETDNTYLIEFAADNDMAENLRKNVCYTLYANEDVFATSAELYKVNNIGGSVEIDKNTMLPISSGIHYNGTYHISGHAYELSFITTQTYRIPSEDALNIHA